MWFYSTADGTVYRTDQFTSKSVAAKLSNYSSPDELVGVTKKVIVSIEVILKDEFVRFNSKIKSIYSGTQ